MSLREFRGFRARPPGGWGREFGAVPIYAVNAARLPAPFALQRLILESGPTEGGAHTREGSGVSKILVLRIGRKGFPGRGERNISRCFNCSLELRNLPIPLSSVKGTPDPESLRVAPESQRREMRLSTDSLRPRSCFTYRVSTLHPFSSCLPSRAPPHRPPPSASPKWGGGRGGAGGNSRLLAVERGSTLSGWGPSSLGPRSARRCLLSPQPRLWSKRPGTLPKSPRGLGSLRPPPPVWNRKP